MDCLFCKIANKKMPVDIVYEDEEILAFKNINPEAPMHFLVIPKRHIEWNDALGAQELLLLSKMIVVAKNIAKEKKIEDAYKMIFNVGKTGHIKHIHLHLLGGWKGDSVPKRNI